MDAGSMFPRTWSKHLPPTEESMENTEGRVLTEAEFAYLTNEVNVKAELCEILHKELQLKEREIQQIKQGETSSPGGTDWC